MEVSDVTVRSDRQTVWLKCAVIRKLVGFSVVYCVFLARRWRGITSLYAAEIAINHLIPDLDESYLDQRIDVETESDKPIGDMIHIHASHSRTHFDKWVFHDRWEFCESVFGLYLHCINLAMTADDCRQCPALPAELQTPLLPKGCRFVSSTFD